MLHGGMESGGVDEACGEESSLNGTDGKTSPRPRSECSRLMDVADCKWKLFSFCSSVDRIHFRSNAIETKVYDSGFFIVLTS